MSAGGPAAYTRIEIANRLDVVALNVSRYGPAGSALRMGAMNWRRRSLDTLSKIKNDRCRPSCLSKIAHMERIMVGDARVTRSNRTSFSLSYGTPGRMGIFRKARLQGVHQLPGLLKLLSTRDADLIGALLDGE